MGLFSKKPKPPKPGTHKVKPAEASDVPAAASAVVAAPSAPAAPAAPPAQRPESGRNEAARQDASRPEAGRREPQRKEPNRAPQPRREPPKRPAPTKAEEKAAAKKARKFHIDPADYLAMRAEVADLRARLEASEQAKAIVESRLAALDATTTAISAGSLGGDDVRNRLASLESQIVTLADTAEAANAAAEAAAAKAATAATVASEAAVVTQPAEADPELAARLADLEARLAEQAEVAAALAAMPAPPPASPETDPALAARLDELAAQVHAAAAVTPPDHTQRLGEIEARLAQVAAAQAAPSLAPIAADPDPELVARVDALAARVEHVDTLAGQLSQLNARVTAQAELGHQLSTLRDRLTELQNEQSDRRAAALAATDDADLRDRVNALADRLAANDALMGQLAQLAERMAANDNAVRQHSEQVAALEQRLDSVATELANQISELGRDIDGLAEVGTPGTPGVSDTVIDHLRTAQVKLANEQARYEIAFREDLAALAERVRRGTI